MAEETPEIYALGRILEVLKSGAIDAETKMSAILEIGLAHRIARLTQRLAPLCGEKVLNGPFRGMRFPGPVTEGCRLPKLLGCYESELHAVLEEAIARGYETVLNIGCAEGYYAVGLARRLPGARIHAFDTNERAREACRALARDNGVAARVAVAGVFRKADFARFAGQRVLVLCDIEGGEFGLLDPGEAPALTGFDLLVEVHEMPGRRAGDLLDRFADSHEATAIRPTDRDPAAFPQLAGLAPLDRALALLERLDPVLWVFLRAKDRDRSTFR